MDNSRERNKKNPLPPLPALAEGGWNAPEWVHDGQDGEDVATAKDATPSVVGEEAPPARVNGKGDWRVLRDQRWAGSTPADPNVESRGAARELASIEAILATADVIERIAIQEADGIGSVAAPWRVHLASWPERWRERWGLRANELQDEGLSWHEAESRAFDEIGKYKRIG